MSKDERVYMVKVPVAVAADNEEEAARAALRELRFPDVDMDTFEVQQIAGPHKKRLHGRCPVCGHWGEDCRGTT